MLTFGNFGKLYVTSHNIWSRLKIITPGGVNCFKTTKATEITTTNAIIIMIVITMLSIGKARRIDLSSQCLLSCDTAPQVIFHTTANYTFGKCWWNDIAAIKYFVLLSEIAIDNKIGNDDWWMMFPLLRILSKQKIALLSQCQYECHRCDISHVSNVYKHICHMNRQT